MIDTHSHLYLDDFDSDRNEAVERAINAGVSRLILPNVDAETLPLMKAMKESYPTYVEMAIGLHPTSVNADYANFLNIVEQELNTGNYVAVGEVGLDFYWDRTFVMEQKLVFLRQIKLASQHNLPVITHTRDAMPELIEVLKNINFDLPRMIFHSFTGTKSDAESILALQSNAEFFFGINGIVTFKNSKLDDMIRTIGLQHILLETDCPYLAPVPYRGKRNESAYVAKVCEKLAEIFNLDIDEIDKITTANACRAFSLPVISA